MLPRCDSSSSFTAVEPSRKCGLTLSRTVSSSSRLQTTVTITPKSKKSVRFFSQVQVREIPHFEEYAVQDRRKMWWSEVEEAMIDREVKAYANMLELNRFPRNKREYAVVRGIVPHTKKVMMARFDKTKKLYKAVFCVQNHSVPRGSQDDSEETMEAKISFKQNLIARLCQNISADCLQNAIKIGSMDARQADMVYDEDSDEEENQCVDGDVNEKNACEVATSNSTTSSSSRKMFVVS